MKYQKKTEQEVREWVATRLGKGDIPSLVWAGRKVQQYLYEYFDYDDDPGEDEAILGLILDQVEDGLPLYLADPEGTHSKGARKPLLNLPLSPHEEARAQAQAAYLAREAATQPFVARFRKRILGYVSTGPASTGQGGLLEIAEAAEFISSAALRCLSPWECRARGIPLVGHQAAPYSETYTPIADQKIRCEVTASGKKLKGWLRDRRVVPMIVFYDTESLLGEKLERKEFVVHERSVIDESRKVALQLERWYGWERGEALRFLLTGKAPMVDPIRGQTKRVRDDIEETALNEITLVIKPWVSEASVIRAFQEGRRYLIGERKVTWSKARNFRILRFVIEHTSETGQPPKLSQLMTLWNETCPPEDRADTAQHFARDYRRAQNALWM